MTNLITLRAAIFFVDLEDVNLESQIITITKFISNTQHGY